MIGRAQRTCMYNSACAQSTHFSSEYAHTIMPVDAQQGMPLYQTSVVKIRLRITGEESVDRRLVAVQLDDLGAVYDKFA
jgi:hypothetical protein